MTNRLSAMKPGVLARGMHCIVPAWFLCGCGGVQSVLDPRGPQAGAIASIAWVMFLGAAAVLLLVTALALYAFYGPRSRERRSNDNAWILAGGIALPVLTLSALLAYGVHSMASMREAAPSDDRIEIIAHRWWWEVQYFDENGLVAVTANEVRIPVATPVAVDLRSRDVIHSFWVPNLAGKMDAIPGRTNRLILHASAPGLFRGQCAEYCGAQHARMGLHVIAQTPAAHAEWLASQREPARMPSDEIAVRGQRLFDNHCAACHTVRGNGAAQRSGPDLTHLASRRFIAGGTLENSRANLLNFITESQSLKAGSGMPSFAHLEQDALHAIVQYLGGLQ